MGLHGRNTLGQERPRTSVIITSFNYTEYLPAAIASVLAQTDRDFELLIVDDGSTDGSLAVARSYSDPRVRVLVEPHRGLGPTRNVGMQAARGRYIAFLDADDIWMPGKLAAQCAVLDRRADIGLVYTRFGVIDASGRMQSRRSYLAPKPSGAILRDLLEGNVIGTPSTICVRREIVEDGNLWFDETRTHLEDWHFYLRVAIHTLVHHLPRTLAYHRQHSKNMGGHVATFMREVQHTGRFGLDLAREHLGLSEREIQRIERRVLAYADALVGREYIKAGNLALARAHAARSLALQPWNIRETVLYLLASMGWVPGVVTRHLK
jgi:glycosyltransferase involved in cell wall biosynthesis